MTEPSGGCERCGGTGRVERGTGYGLDDRHDICTTCFRDTTLGLDDEHLGRAMARASARRKATSRLVEAMLWESTVFGGLTPTEAARRVMHERETLRRHLVQADQESTSAAVDDAIEFAVPLAHRGRLSSASEVGQFVRELAGELAADAEYCERQPSGLRRPGSPR